MNKPKTRHLSAMRIAITGSVIAGIINLILVGGAYLRQAASQELDAEKDALRDNINSLEVINQERLDGLQDELDQIRAEVEELEAAFPELGAPFAIYSQALAISRENQVDLLTITLQSTDIHETYQGTVVEKQYGLELAGNMEDCLAFIGDLEQAGRETLAMKYINLLPLDYSCSLEVSLMGFPGSSAE